MSETTVDSLYLEAGTPAYRQANLAMFLGGFATFSLLYGPQPLLPLFASYFGVSPAGASLTLSASTAALAFMLIPFSMLSDRFGRGTLMKCSLFGSAFFTLLLPLAHSLPQFLFLRVLLGVAIAGLPATAMAWLGEEIAPNARGRAMGLYIAGNAFGGMSGRFIIAFITEWSSWQTAFLVSGLIGLTAAMLFWRNVPDSRHFRARPIQISSLVADLGQVLGERGLQCLFLVSFLLMGAFVALYNYFGFRLESPAYGLTQTTVSAIFLLYALGTVASAWTGRLVDKIGRGKVLWRTLAIMACGLLFTQFHSLWLVVPGVALFTIGFFGSHSTASGWVGERAGSRRALGSAIYLTAYYLGGSLIGSLAGYAWSWGDWLGVSAALACCLGFMLWLARKLPQLPQRPIG
ncbi:MAG TPA: MFS transporter [Limnobacter sp.]|uniref:MFS transporter n=1 Tax=Limnobacter sp. TaxID=2003368 RepID=UPI002E32B4DF|nr:MFS transporter [Limnobacter sp.]HEX5485894.1 MFS transporter [Limnobacter sp.]